MAKIKNRHSPTAFDRTEKDGPIGNIWGNKMTLYGVIFLVVLFLFMCYRFYDLGVSPLDEHGHVIYRDSL